MVAALQAPLPVIWPLARGAPVWAPRCLEARWSLVVAPPRERLPVRARARPRRALQRAARASFCGKKKTTRPNCWPQDWSGQAWARVRVRWLELGQEPGALPRPPALVQVPAMRPAPGLVPVAPQARARCGRARGLLRQVLRASAVHLALAARPPRRLAGRPGKALEVSFF